jgi:hypothetical protein
VSRNRICTLSGSAERWLTLTKNAPDAAEVGGGVVPLPAPVEPVSAVVDGSPTARPEAPVSRPPVGDPAAPVVTETDILPVPGALGAPVDDAEPRPSADCEPSRPAAPVVVCGFEETPSMAAAAAATAPIAPSAIAETTACRIGRALCRGLADADDDEDDDDDPEAAGEPAGAPPPGFLGPDGLIGLPGACGLTGGRAGPEPGAFLPPALATRGSCVVPGAGAGPVLI